MIASLYERLGGAKGIQAMVEDALAAHLRNPLISHRFADIDGFHEAGDSWISDEEFQAVVDDIMAVAGRQYLDDLTKVEILAILQGLKKDLVRA